MNSDDEMVLWGTIRGWAKKLGISEEILKERCKGLPTHPCTIREPNNPEATIISESYAEPDVMEVCADLLRPMMVDTEDLVAGEILKEISKEKEGP